MKNITKQTLLASAVALCLGTGAQANETPYYAKAELGYNFNNKYKDYTPEGAEALNGQKSKDKLSYGLELGYKFDENFRLGLSVNLLNQKFKKSYQELVDVTVSTKTTSNSVMLTGYYDLPEISMVQPYFSVGIGAAKNKHKDYSSSEVLEEGIEGSKLSMTSIYRKGSKTNFAWAVGVGSQVPINDNFALDFSVKYYDYGKAATKKGVYSNGQLAPNTGNDYTGTKVKGIAANAGLVFKF